MEHEATTPMMQHRREIFLILALGLASRLAALPWAMVHDSDAVVRTLDARFWLAQPTLITYGVWGPIHTYLIAAALALWHNPVYAPTAVSIIFSVGAAAVLYAFTREAFDPRAAFPVACAYLLYPVAFRASLQPEGEGPFTFFVLLAFWLAGRARRPEGRPHQAALAGLALTLAGGIRFEAWLLAPLLAVVMPGRSTWRRTLLFLACASLFPLFWTAGNWHATGDPFYSIHYTSRFVNEAEGYNAHVTAGMRLIRLFFFPFTLFCGLTPPVFLACLAGLGLALWRRRPGARWAVPLLVLTGLLILKAFRGEIAAKGRYMHLPGVLLLPYLAPALAWARQRWPEGRRAGARLALFLAAMIPLSYAGLAIPGMVRSFFVKNIIMIPRVGAPGPQAAAAINRELQGAGGSLIIDFFGWAETYYAIYESRIPAERVWIAPGARHESPDLKNLAAWLGDNPAGLLVLRRGSALEAQLQAAQGVSAHVPGSRQRLDLRQAADVTNLRIYRYRLIAENPVGALKLN